MNSPPITTLPGSAWLDTGRRRGEVVRLRGVSFGPVTARNPPLRSWLVIAHRRGETAMSRRIGSRVERADIRPSQISLHPWGTPALWSWDAPIEVLHVHVPTGLLDQAAREVFGAPLSQVRLRHGIGMDDPALVDLAFRLERAATGEGAPVLDDLAGEMAALILRGYGAPGEADRQDLDPAQRARLRDLIANRLDAAIRIEDLARAAGLGRSRFCSRFSASFGMSPHQFVLDRRIETAARLLRESRLPVAQIAATAGFADQSHLTRQFLQRRGVTPAAYRRRERADGGLLDGGQSG